MTNRFTLSPLIILGMVLFLAAGELASGTGLVFVALMSVATIAICITYNMLGGLGTIGGVLFSAFALYTVLLSQFAKVFMFEAADLNLPAPGLTMAVYATFFVSLMVGVFLFGWIRLNLPRPIDPASTAHSGVMYALSFVLGLAATIYMTNLALEHPESATGGAHGVARALSLLLMLSLVIAVDSRIRKTEGRHCFGWAAFWPVAAIEILGFASGSRSGFMVPPLLVAVTSYFRGYKFKARHYVAAGAMVAVLFLFVSPWYLYARRWRNQPSLEQQITTMARLAADAPEHWKDVKEAVEEGATAGATRGGQYFSRWGTVTLNRFELIAQDGAVISACSHYHWGFATLKIDLANGLPHFIYPNKPDRDGTWYRASVGGLQSSYAETSYITTSIIADSWGGFGWMGVIAVPLLLLPWMFVLYESIFDIRRPWGTVTALYAGAIFPVASIGGILTVMMIQIPVYILLISWFAGWTVRYLSLQGDTRHRRGVPLFAPDKIRNVAGD